MIRQCYRMPLLLFLLIFSSGENANSQILVDNFDDGLDDGWVHVHTGDDQAWGPGIFDASSGAYHLTTTGSVPRQGRGVLTSFWQESGDSFYDDGFWQATVRAQSSGTNIAFFLRNGYLFTTDLSVTRELDVWDCQGFTSNCTFLDGYYGPVPGFVQGEDWVLEAGVVDNLISARMWRKGESRPAQPNVKLQDNTYASGEFGVAGFIGSAWTQPARTDAVFDDIYFMPANFPGDYDASGVVDQGDLDLVLLNWGNGLTRLSDPAQVGWVNDLAIDAVDQQELDKVLLNWGNAIANVESAVVPEPATLMIAWLVGALAIALRFKSRS